MDEQFVELSDAIGEIRAQLIEAQRQGLASSSEDDLTFTVDKVVLELTGEVTSTVGGGGGVKFWVVSAEGKGERARAATQKITIELVPHTAGGHDYAVNDGVSAPPTH